MKKLFNLNDRVTVKVGEDQGGKSGIVSYIYSSGSHVNITLDNGEVRFLSTATLDLTPAKTEAAAAVKKAPTGNRDTFTAAATKALVKVARKQSLLTTDDIWAEMARANPEGFNVEPRMMGGFMIEAQKQGVVKGTNTYKKSVRPECHKRPVKIWTSSLYRGK